MATTTLSLYRQSPDVVEYAFPDHTSNRPHLLQFKRAVTPANQKSAAKSSHTIQVIRGEVDSVTGLPIPGTGLVSTNTNRPGHVPTSELESRFEELTQVFQNETVMDALVHQDVLPSSATLVIGV